MDEEDKKEINSLFNLIWEDLVAWDKDDIHINGIRIKLRNLEVKVFELL